MVARKGGAAKLLHRGPRVTSRIVPDLEFATGRRIYAELTRDHADGLLLTGAWSYPPPDSAAEITDGVREDLDGIQIDRKQLREICGEWHVYHFMDTSPDSSLRQIPAINDNHQLRPDGSNLAAFLYRIQCDYESHFNGILNAVRLVAPFLEEFHLEPSALDSQKIHLEWRHVGIDDYFDSSSLSDGALRFIALATLLLQPRQLRPSITLLEEPELGLHPTAISVLAALLAKASIETQLIVATQSATLLDRLDPHDVIVADRVQGSTRLKRLDRNSLSNWLEDYSLGELWEKNELDGRPAAEHSLQVNNH